MVNNQSLTDNEFEGFRSELHDQGYELVGVVGTGAMGTVYYGHHRHLKREVAIKVLSRSLLNDPHAQHRFLNEMSTMARVNHPAIVNVYDGGVTRPGIPFFVMEYVNGPTLAEHIGSKPGSFSPHEVAQVLAPIGAALDYLHNPGDSHLSSALAEPIVHRDVKPANIILSQSGAKLTDFGISFITDDTRLTYEGNFVGTLAYTAPELFTSSSAENRPEPGAASDNYSLSLIALEMLTGVRLDQTMSEYAWRGYRPLDFLDEVPAADVFKLALANDPDERYPSAMSFLRELEFASDSSAANAGVDSTSPPRPRWSQRVRPVWMVVALVLACAFTVGAIGVAILGKTFWAVNEQFIAESFPQLIPARDGGKGWSSTTCRTGLPTQDQLAVIQCSGTAVAYSVADYGTRDERDRYPAQYKKAFRSPKCTVEQTPVGDDLTQWMIFPDEPRGRFLILLSGDEANKLRLQIPVC